MSVLADIYISKENKALEYDTAPEQFPDRSQYKGLTPLELSILWSIMQDIEWDVSMMEEFRCVLQIDGGERLIHQIPLTMNLDLVALRPDRIASVTSAWAASEEVNGDPDDIRPVVDDLVRLARRAVETTQRIYLWNCV